MTALTLRSHMIRYALVGVANTCITAAIIFSLMHFGLGLYASNAIGYIAGIIFSFIANTIFTFSVSISGSRFLRFLITCLSCWLINIFFVKFYTTLFPEQLYSSQIFGMIFYTLSGFFINKLWVMK